MKLFYHPIYLLECVDYSSEQRLKLCSPAFFFYYAAVTNHFYFTLLFQTTILPILSFIYHSQDYNEIANCYKFFSEGNMFFSYSVTVHVNILAFNLSISVISLISPTIFLYLEFWPSLLLLSSLSRSWLMTFILEMLFRCLDLSMFWNGPPKITVKDFIR